MHGGQRHDNSFDICDMCAYICVRIGGYGDTCIQVTVGQSAADTGFQAGTGSVETVIYNEIIRKLRRAAMEMKLDLSGGIHCCTPYFYGLREKTVQSKCNTNM